MEKRTSNNQRAVTSTPQKSEKKFASAHAIYLAKNECPYGDYNRYPSDAAKLLRQKISKLKNLQPDEVYVGHSSRHIIDTIFRAFCAPGDKVLTFTPGSSLFTDLAKINRVEMIELPLNKHFQIDLEALSNYVQHQDLKFIFICNPNNPTGNLLAKEDILQILEQFKGVVYIDESYLDFSERNSLITELPKFDNLIIGQSLSMAWGMAGVRLAFSFMKPNLVKELDKICPQNQVGILNQEFVANRLDFMNCYAACVEEVIEERTSLQQDLEAFSFFKKIYPSETNFIMAEVTDATELCTRLELDNVYIKNLHDTMPNHVRISVGSPYENYMLLESLRAMQLDS